MRSRWAGTRALLIALVLFFWTMESLPLPMLSRRHMNRTMAIEEVDRWVDILGRLGIQTDSEEVVRRVISVSKRSLSIRRTIIKPARVVERQLGMGQAWGLFTFADPYPGRLVIEGTRGGNAWFTLYRDPETDGSRLAETVRNRRVRGVWDDAGDRPKPGKIYSRFAGFIAGRVFEEHPDIQEVRVRLDKVTVRTPNQRPVTGPDKPRHIREYRREDGP